MAKNLSNPAPLGLMAFGTTTVLLNLANAGLFSIDSMILSMGIFYGGLAQIIAGILEFRRGNTFGTLAFLSYGFFWESFVFIHVLSGLNWATAPDNTSLGFYLLIWGIFTLLMFFGTLKINKALQVIFATLTILFFLLSIAEFSENSRLVTLAGIEGVICGGSAIYLSIAEVLNEIHGKKVLPVGTVKKKK